MYLTSLVIPIRFFSRSDLSVTKMAALYKSLRLGSAPRLLQLASPAVNGGQQQRHLNLLEYQAKGLLQVRLPYF